MPLKMRKQLQQSLEEGCRAEKRGLQFGAGYDVIRAWRKGAAPKSEVGSLGLGMM